MNSAKKIGIVNERRQVAIRMMACRNNWTTAEAIRKFNEAGVVAPQLKKYRSFKKARAFARNLGLKNQAEWRAFTKSKKLPSDIPANPNNTYKDKGWVSMGDWLGK